MSSSNNESIIREMMAGLKGRPPSEDIITYIKNNDNMQCKIINTFNINNVFIREYDLKYNKIEFINNISSFYYKGRVGRRIDLLVYYKSPDADILLGYIQLASPILNVRLTEHIKTYMPKVDFSHINDKYVDMSICVGTGPLRDYLIGKLLVFIAMSREIVGIYNNKYNAHVTNLYTTSIYGKSSMYNRVRGLKYLGLTEGYHAVLTKEQIEEINTKYKEHFPNRRIKVSALSQHTIRLYDHLKTAGVPLTFEIPKLKKGVYLCTELNNLEDNIQYWYNRWFIPRRDRLNAENHNNCDKYK